MSDKHIEDMLRQSWDPEPPDVMRGRVLGRARREIRPRSGARSLFLIRGWKPALAILALLFLLMSGVSEHTRGVRLAELTGSDASLATQNICKFQGWNMNATYALRDTGELPWDNGKEDGHESNRTN